MKAWIGWFLAIAMMAMSSGCAGTSTPVPVDPNLNETNSAALFVYRNETAFHSLDPEKPFIYVDGHLIGKLGVGDTIFRRVPPGKHRISVRGSFLFSPAQEEGFIEANFVPGKSYYLRYSYDASEFIPAPVPVVTGTSNLRFVDQESWSRKR